MTSDLLVGNHPQPVSYYLRLIGTSFRTMLDMGMLAIGSALVGLAVAVFGDTFGVFGIGLELSTSAALGAALVVGILGAFAVGIASEGGYGLADSARMYPLGELGVARMVGSLVVGLLLTTLANRSTDLIGDLSMPIQAAHDLIRATGTAGLLVMPLLGVPIATAARLGLQRLGMSDRLDLPILYVIWTITVLLTFNMPT